MDRLKLYFNLEIVWDDEGIYFFYALTPEWLWSRIPVEERRDTWDGDDYSKWLKGTVFGKAIEVAFLQDGEWRHQLGKKHIPDARPRPRWDLKYSKTTSPTASDTSPTVETTLPEPAHAAPIGEAEMGKIEDVLSLYRSRELAHPVDYSDALDYSMVVLHQVQTGKKAITPEAWGNLTNIARIKMIKRAWKFLKNKPNGHKPVTSAKGNHHTRPLAG